MIASETRAESISLVCNLYGPEHGYHVIVDIEQLTVTSDGAGTSIIKDGVNYKDGLSGLTCKGFVRISSAAIIYGTRCLDGDKELFNEWDIDRMTGKLKHTDKQNETTGSCSKSNVKQKF